MLRQGERPSVLSALPPSTPLAAALVAARRPVHTRRPPSDAALPLLLCSALRCVPPLCVCIDAFVTFDSPESADKAFNELQGADLLGSKSALAPSSLPIDPPPPPSCTDPRLPLRCVVESTSSARRAATAPAAALPTAPPAPATLTLPPAPTPPTIARPSAPAPTTTPATAAAQTAAAPTLPLAPPAVAAPLPATAAATRTTVRATATLHPPPPIPPLPTQQPTGRIPPLRPTRTRATTPSKAATTRPQVDTPPLHTRLPPFPPPPTLLPPIPRPLPPALPPLLPPILPPALPAPAPPVAATRPAKAATAPLPDGSTRRVLVRQEAREHTRHPRRTRMGAGRHMQRRRRRGRGRRRERPGFTHRRNSRRGPLRRARVDSEGGGGGRGKDERRSGVDARGVGEVLGANDKGGEDVRPTKWDAGERVECVRCSAVL